ncbi:MAG: ABC transporter permease [Candidatus Acetothermia bacterium]
MGKYFGKKFLIYLLTFFVAVTINWVAPRLIPGDPVQMMMATFRGPAEGRIMLERELRRTFGLEGSLLQQYGTFWARLLRGDLGTSITQYPRQVIDIVRQNIVYDIAILFPAIVLSWIVGNEIGALAGDNEKVDNYVMPFIYALISSPYFWFAIIVVFIFSHQLGWFPTAQAHSGGIERGFNVRFIVDALRHWFLPFITMFLVTLGQWAIGMRNMIIYEVESNYSNYLESLGASDTLVRRYAFRNGVLPQVTGFAIQLGQTVSGAILVQQVFNYPGLGHLMLDAVNQQDFYLLQGAFLSLIIMVLAANFLVDIIYMFIDPRIRVSYTEEA